MPNRLLRDSICVSDTIDRLTWREEACFYRLIVNCDDFGRCDGRPAIIKAKLFPLKDITNKDIEETLSKLSTAGLVYRYEANGRPFLQLVTWEKYQTIRNKKSKYPAPEEGTPIDKWWEFENGCYKLKSIDCNSQTNVSVIQSNPIQSNTESESESNSMLGADKSASKPEQEAAIYLLLNDKSLYGISQQDIDHWQELYPAVNVMQEMRKMQGWLEATPQKRKTKRGIKKFINGWLSREQDKGGVSRGSYGNAAYSAGAKPQFGEVL